MSRPRFALIVAALAAALGLLGGAAFLFGGSAGEVFMPHADCYLFVQKLIVLQGGSDLLIGLSFIAISATLTYLVLRARRELPFHWMMLAFAIVIVACGGTHLMELWTLRAPHPRYWLAGWVKVLTAVASVTTAVILPPLVPRILAVLKSARLAGERKAQLETAYAELDGLYRKVTDLDQLKTRFFANVSHELRTPLALISAPVERLLRSAQLDDDGRKDLDIVRRNALILNKHVNDLLDVSKLDAGKMETHYARIDLARMTRLMASAFDSMVAARRVSLDIETPAELIVEVDGDKIERVLVNLFSNAVKFAPAEGRIAVNLRAENGEALLRVDDSGPGVPLEFREEIFERFHRGDAETQRRFGGTGLGLSIAREFVALHRGALSVGQSSFGGASFLVRIPLKAPPGFAIADSVWVSEDPVLRRARELRRDGEEARWARAQSSALPARSNSLPADKPLVLVAEDNQDMNDFICRILSSEVRTLPAANGRAALELARTRRPDLILTDLVMPELSGNELVAAIRAERELADIPIILLTARADDEARLGMLVDGAQDYVMKPFSIEELRARVRNQVVTKVTRDTLRRELDSQSQDLAELAQQLSARARELEAAKNDAEAANRAKDQFLAVLSHELRTPLTPALAAATNLEEGEGFTPAELRDSLAMIRRNIELEARLVDDLLDLTRISKGKLQVHTSPINLHETIRHAVDMGQSEARNRGAELRISLEAGDHHVNGDGARLAQVLWNLILNAVKFTPAGGCIGVRTSNPARGSVRIEVSDTGLGIEPELLSHIFEPFQQGEASTVRRYGGLGLGLSVAKGLVDAHGGTISARSDGKNRGATFTIELPTVIPPPVPETAAPRRAVAARRSLRILLVEDHEDTRRAIERLLLRWGHTVATAATVERALETAVDFRPELLLSDVGLPDGTGMDLLGKLRHGPALLAVAMTGYGMESDLDQTREAGFIEHLVKPVSAERLKEVIGRLAARL